jgi:hypothetical protein
LIWDVADMGEIQEWLILKRIKNLSWRSLWG